MLCSEKGLENQRENKSWFRKREYPKDLISFEMRKVNFSNLRSKRNCEMHNMKGMSLVGTYHPLRKSLSAIIDKSLFAIFIWIKM